MNITKLQQGKDAHIRWNGALYNDSMHKAAQSLAAILEEDTGELEGAWQALDFDFGREVLSNQYSKLSRLCYYVKSAKVAGWSPPKLMAYMIRMLRLTFQCRIQLPSKAVESWLDKDRKTGALGLWPALLVVLEAWLLDF